MISTIRDFEDKYQHLPDLIRCSLGEPYFGVDARIRVAAIKQLMKERSTYPSYNETQVLLQALAKKHHMKSDQIVLTHGASEGLFIALSRLFKEGDELILPIPTYPGYLANCQHLGISVKTIDLKSPMYDFDFIQLNQQLSDKCKGILIQTHHNPTGQCISEVDLQRLVLFCKEKELALLIDRTYHAYEKELSVSLDCPFVEFYSFSKTYGMCGYRIGYLTASQEFLPVLKDTIKLSCVEIDMVAQSAALSALSICPMTEVKKTLKRSQKLINLLVRYEIQCSSEPGYYTYFDVSSLGMDALTFCDSLAHEAQILMLPGNFFGPNQSSYVRCCCCSEPFDDMLLRLEHFLWRKC